MNNLRHFKFGDLTIDLHPEVYNPAEDTFDLIEAIDDIMTDPTLEIGTGCGIISLLCASRGLNVVCTDVNPYAIALTQHNYKKNKMFLSGDLDIRLGNLFSVCSPNEEFKQIIFNPPYLPIPNEQRIYEFGWFDVATNGGANGLLVIRRFINDLTPHLSSGGTACFAISSFADLQQLHIHIASAHLKHKIIHSRWYGDERINIYQISKQ